MFGKRLRILRERSGESQREVAEAIGVSPNTLSNYENDNRYMDIDILRKVCEHFDCTSDYILGYAGQPYSLGLHDESFPKWMSNYYELDDDDKARIEERIMVLYESRDK